MPTSTDLIPHAPPVTRRAFLAAAAAVAAGGLLPAAWYAEHGNALEVVRSTPPGAAAPAPLRIALVTDLHAPHTYVAMDEIAAAVRAFDPDLLFIVGDSIEKRDDAAQLRAFEPLAARYGKFATMGNHDHWSGAGVPRLRREYERAGVRLLVNEEVAVDVGGRRVQLAGLDDWRAGRPDYALVEAGRPGWRDADRRIVLTHCPIAFDAACAVAGGAPLDAFAGHTHGGQVAPLGQPLVLPKGSGRYAKGWYEGPAAGQRLYVSRGLGNSGVRFRVGARPELALIEA